MEAAPSRGRRTYTQIAARLTPGNQALVITAAYTGMRWGELAGLRRPNCKLADGRISIDPDTGAPHEVGGKLDDLRHSHKTWLIEDGVPEAAQAKRLGHRLPGVRGIYSHVTAAVEQRLAAGLQTRWEQNRSPFRRDNLGN